MIAADKPKNNTTLGNLFLTWFRLGGVEIADSLRPWDAFTPWSSPALNLQRLNLFIVSRDNALGD